MHPIRLAAPARVCVCARIKREESGKNSQAKGTTAKKTQRYRANRGDHKNCARNGSNKVKELRGNGRQTWREKEAKIESEREWWRGKEKPIRTHTISVIEWATTIDQYFPIIYQLLQFVAAAAVIVVVVFLFILSLCTSFWVFFSHSCVDEIKSNCPAKSNDWEEYRVCVCLVSIICLYVRYI